MTLHTALVALAPACEIISALTGLLGSVLLALHTRISPWGWIAYLVANLASIVFLDTVHAHWLIAQQAGFTVSSAVGLIRSDLVRPRWRAWRASRTPPPRSTSRARPGSPKATLLLTRRRR
jgi:hypothetical protein